MPDFRKEVIQHTRVPSTCAALLTIAGGGDTARDALHLREEELGMPCSWERNELRMCAVWWEQRRVQAARWERLHLTGSLVGDL